MTRQGVVVMLADRPCKVEPVSTCGQLVVTYVHIHYLQQSLPMVLPCSQGSPVRFLASTWLPTTGRQQPGGAWQLPTQSTTPVIAATTQTMPNLTTLTALPQAAWCLTAPTDAA